MAFLQSTWFMWVCIVIIVCSILSNLWLSFIEESGVEPSEIFRVLLKIIFFIPMLIIGGIMVAIEKKAWGALVFGIIMAAIIIYLWFNDPGESPAPWNS